MTDSPGDCSSPPERSARFSPTSEQKAILGHDHARHARVLAGPGTGKSTTMVAFLTGLLEKSPEVRVRMLTFTRAATAELAEKIEGHAERVERPSTIHSFAISILLRNPGTGGFPEPLRIVDSWEAKELINPSLAKRSSVSVPRLKDLIREMAANWESLVEERNPRIPEPERARFRGAWHEHRRILGYTLLQELPYALHAALEVHELSGMKFDLLVVDEYQDLNACDLSILKKVSEQTGCAVIAVGDDDQSIYSWRKAAPEGIRRFLSEYAGAADYSLSVTLRCGKRIIEWANEVIVGDPDRPKDRAVLNAPPGAPDGEAALLDFRSNVAEAKGVAELVHRLIEKEGLTPRDVLILMRTDNNGTFSQPIRKELAKRGIQSSDPSSVETLLAEPENRWWMELARLVVDASDSVAWAGLLRLQDGVGEKFIEHVYELARERGVTFAVTLSSECARGFPDGPRSSKLAKDLIEKVQAWLSEITVPDERPVGGWDGWLGGIASGQQRFPNPSADFLDLMKAVEELLGEDDLELHRFLGQIEPIGKDLAAAKSEGVRLMTMSGSKGLTVQAAIVAGVEEALVPRPGSSLAEERRILYVAMTRAKEYLFCTWAKQRRGPTARSGQGTLERRTLTHFLRDLKVRSESGEVFLTRRWP